MSHYGREDGDSSAVQLGANRLGPQLEVPTWGLEYGTKDYRDMAKVRTSFFQ